MQPRTLARSQDVSHRHPVARSLQRATGWLIVASGSLVLLAGLLHLQRLTH
jgi:hypothetical protein